VKQLLLKGAKRFLYHTQYFTLFHFTALFFRDLCNFFSHLYVFIVYAMYDLENK